MNFSALRSPALWGLLVLALVSLWGSNLVWAGPDASPPRQTVPSRVTPVYLPLIQKNYSASSPSAASSTDCSRSQEARLPSDAPSLSGLSTENGDRQTTLPKMAGESTICLPASTK